MEGTAHRCKAIFVSAPASGQGKTTVTAGMARQLRNTGLRVSVFKTGPDYLDPLILERAAGMPAEQLDLWMVGEANCRNFLYQAAAHSDVILIEGVMGLYDGDPSGADLAQLFGLPVLCVIDASAMAQTTAAVALGLQQFRPALMFAGVIANRVGSDRHSQLIQDALPESLPFWGALKTEGEICLPQRHLGLVNPEEVSDYDKILDTVGERIQAAIQAVAPASTLFDLLPDCEFRPVYQDRIDDDGQGVGNSSAKSVDLSGKKIGIARDAAFSFIYPANLRFLQEQGAEVCFFSPLTGERLPEELDALWFPGGYPELHVEKLSQNRQMHAAVRDFVTSGRPVLAECGGMLYLQRAITLLDGSRWPLANLLPAEGVMRTRGGCQGMQTAPLPEGHVRGHAHHRTVSTSDLAPIAFGKRIRHPAPGEPIFRYLGITASYLHLYFWSNPAAIVALFRAKPVLNTDHCELMLQDEKNAAIADGFDGKYA
ncbi:MAG: cobyrinate a,c-diamide synthase [Pseudomonadales bacterium]|nr:cobyrinate a,c-diamide synthase [Pseudomonadales bacterium]